ncbi:MAG: PorV/PorQ family protein [Ignavibacteriales bacterium]|nr:PorV/PorQ family protein [Ignavibacteriales bacterium]
MIKIYRIFLLSFLICASNSISLSQKVATTSMQFLKVMPCARANAMGDAYSALASGAEAIFWNPSGLALASNHEITSTYINWIFDAQQGALGYAMPLVDFGVLGFQIQYVDYGSFDEAVLYRPYIKEVPEPGLTGRSFRPFSYLIGISYARSLTDKFSTGVSIKFAHESLFDQSRVQVVDAQNGLDKTVDTYGNAILFDFGIRYNTGFKSIQVAASVQNFGPEIKYAIQKNSAPLLFRVGASADLIGPNSVLMNIENNRIGIAADLFQPNDYDQQVHVGAEYEFAHVFALRAGYKYNYDNEGFTAGAGFNHKIDNIKLSVDYGYGSIGTYLGSAHRISLGIGIQ